MAKIAIDAGHGLYTSGKRCLKSLDANQTREWVLNDRVADALGAYLKSAGHTILRVDDTDGSTDISLANRVRTANNWKADAYISVHHNAGIGGGSGGGTVVYVSKNCSSKSVQLQNAIYKHAIEDCGLKGNRSDGTLASNFYVIKNTNSPAILIEVGFMDSKTDIKYILNPEWSKKMGVAIAKGVCDVYGGKIPAPKEEVYADWYKEPINWAIKNGITAEKDLKAFDPNRDCKRAEVITFIWRAEGCPEPKEAGNPFKDINASNYFYKAVLWAMENGITSGVDIAEFGPDEVCTRAQIVTFLWRLAGQPEPTVKTTSFEDVAADAYYYKAVLWANENNITAGVSKTEFAPDKPCTRGQVVTFLYRIK